MVRAKIQNGVIVPLDPIPTDRHEGTELDVTSSELPELSDEKWAALSAEPTDESRENDRIVREIIDEQRRISKEQVRREMGLLP